MSLIVTRIYVYDGDPKNETFRSFIPILEAGNT